MPRPHFPPHAGPYTPAWTSDPGASRLTGSEPRNRAALEAEIARLREELVQMQRDEAAYPPSGDNASRAKTMLWCTLALCGAALLFAVIAIIYHG